MDWVQIGIFAITVLGALAIYYNYKKASRLKTPSELDTRTQELPRIRETENLEAGKPKLPWADDPIANSIEWTEASDFSLTAVCEFLFVTPRND